MTEVQAVHVQPRRWLALAIIASAEFMVILDATVVNIALPSASRDLGISQADRQWLLTAYTLPLGALLLAGGRVADHIGRKRTLLIGLVGFAAASALGGFATTEGLLFTARALQGVFGALMAPAAYSLITVTFRETGERAKAFGVLGALAGAGSGIGLILGGALTTYGSWRWCLLINVPIAVVTAVAAVLVLRESATPGGRREDAPGILLGSLGLGLLVYGLNEAAQPRGSGGPTGALQGWTSHRTLLLLAGAVVLLVAFVVRETRATHPMLPLRLLADRSRGALYLVVVLVGAGVGGMWLFLTLWAQVNEQWSAMRTGLAFLPITVAAVVSAGLVSRALPRFGAKPVVLVGLGLEAAAMVWMTWLPDGHSFVGHVLPFEIALGLGLSAVFVTASSTALASAPDRDAGIASAVFNAAQQVGTALGTALLNTLFVAAARAYTVAHPERGGLVAAIHGYHHAFAASAGFLVLAIVVAALLPPVRAVSAGAVEVAVATGDARP